MSDTAIAQRVERRTLSEQLAFLALEARKVSDAGLGEAFQLQLEHAARTAQTREDEAAILRAEAADRERWRSLVQLIAAEVDRHDPLHGSADLTLAVIRDAIKRAAVGP